MKLYYDLHIHTALSPCADLDMTPNNIINMAILKKLDIIAITDHNSSENCQACFDAVNGKDLMIIPGMELQTKEEVHLLCFFRSLKTSLIFNKHIQSLLTKTKNIPEIFGVQYILDSTDKVIREETRMLISSVDISIKEAVTMVESLEGLVIPAHIDRPSFSILSNLGFIPNELSIPTVELSKCCHIDRFFKQNQGLCGLRYIQNSDAHRLADIQERINYLETPKKKIDCFFESLANKN